MVLQTAPRTSSTAKVKIVLDDILLGTMGAVVLVLWDLILGKLTLTIL